MLNYDEVLKTTLENMGYPYHPSEILFKPPQLPIPFWESGEEVPRVNGDIEIKHMTIKLGNGSHIDYVDYSINNSVLLPGRFRTAIPGLMNSEFQYRYEGYPNE